MSWPAKYAGVCQSCDQGFAAGTEIVHVAGSMYAHAACPEVVDLTPRPTCPVCNLELPASGECGWC